jgi:hypothetical protein
MVKAPDAILVRRYRKASGYQDEVFHDASTSCAR